MPFIYKNLIITVMKGKKMKKGAIISLASVAVVALISLLFLWWPVSESRLHDGDIVFRGTNWGVATLTASKWTHCGVVFKENGQWIVYDAVGKRSKPKTLKEWKRFPYIYRVVRPKTPLSEQQLKKAKRYLKNNWNKYYDNSYCWTDNKQYCSELVWKSYHAAGVDLTEPRKVNSFLVYKILPEKAIKKIIKQKGFSIEDPMVPPCDLVHSTKVRRVW